MDTVVMTIQSRTEAQVAALKYVDEDWGQLDYYSPNPPVKWPCALIDVISVQWSNYGKKGQLGLARIRVRLADLRTSNSSGKAPAGQKAASNSFYTLTQNVFKALHGWSGADHYSALMRESEGRIKRDDGIKEHAMIFTTQIKDSSAIEALGTLAAETVNPDIQTEMAAATGGEWNIN